MSDTNTASTPAASAQKKSSFVAVPVVALLGAGLAIAGGTGGVRLGPLPLFALAVAVAFVVQWLVFIPSYAQQTERFFDLTGSLTFIGVTVGVLVLSPDKDARAWLLGAMIIIWAARLGSFLFRRVTVQGHDDRFDKIKPDLPRFLTVWTIQGLWVSVTASAAWIAITSTSRVALDWLAYLGVAIWLFGFIFEVVADAQKSAFKADAANSGRFISSGLWSVSRHPNYVGEITLWIGVALVALPVLTGWQYVGLLSPVLVALLLVRVSGIPLLEAKADARWGGQPDYEAYKAKTPVLIPRMSRA